MYAETEVALAFLLFERGRQGEALSLLQHALPVLATQAPNHPILAQFQNHLSRPAVDPSDLANAALTARASGDPLPDALVEGLRTLRAAGSPHDIVADFLEQVARGAPLPSVPAGLPDVVAGFIAAVREAAEKVEIPA